VSGTSSIPLLTTMSHDNNDDNNNLPRPVDSSRSSKQQQIPPVVQSSGGGVLSFVNGNNSNHFVFATYIPSCPTNQANGNERSVFGRDIYPRPSLGTQVYIWSNISTCREISFTKKAAGRGTVEARFNKSFVASFRLLCHADKRSSSKLYITVMTF
jgi:hypothetical protein